MATATLTEARLQLRSCIQKVATGPEYSKDLSLDEAREAMATILRGEADPVQTAILLIAMRMKRETDDENRGVLRALIDAAEITTAAVDEVVDLADPYDGWSRGLPATPFLPAVLAACGVATVSHGLEAVGPKFGITHRKVLRAAGAAVDSDRDAVANALADGNQGWAYIDQHEFCKPLHDLVPLRTTMVKRTVLTTVEVLLGPVRGRKQTHLVTGYVHKAYPPIYASLAREAGFDTAAIIRGVEGGIIPSLQQEAKVFAYHARGAEQEHCITPTEIGIESDTRATPLPTDLPKASAGDNRASDFDCDAAAERAAENGLAALDGKPGPARDSLIYGGAIVLHHLRRADDMVSAARLVRDVLDNGAARARFQAACNK